MHDRRPSSIYMTLSAEGAAEEQSQLSLPRKAFMALCATLLLLSAPMLWSGMAEAGTDSPSAVLTKKGSDDDSAGSSDDDDGDDDTSGKTGQDTDNTAGNTGENTDRMTGKETRAQNTDAPGINTGESTRGETDPGDDTGKTENGDRKLSDDDTSGKTGKQRDLATGIETQAQNTDRPGLNTGVSTRGETDPGDKTGKTERR